MDPSRALVLLVATVAMAAAGVGGDIAADQAECMNTLIGLQTCLPFVQEQAAAAAPTRECCAGLKTVVQTSPKCLCMLVKDKDDPSLQGFKIDATKALGLPQACKTPADVSKCPGTYAFSFSLARSDFLSFSDICVDSLRPPLACTGRIHVARLREHNQFGFHDEAVERSAAMISFFHS
jgi:hypothetical protein